MAKQTDNNLTTLLTTEEKISLQTGSGCWNTAPVEKLNVKSVTFSDGPVGLRKMQGEQTLPAVAFPSIAKLACSFDTDLMRNVGVALGEQCRAEGVDVLLAPGINIKRDPRCGRNFEYFSEDPYLTAELANAYITGVHSQNVGVCVKHFAANSQEYGRLVSDSVIDNRALREIYLNAFEKVVKKSKPCAVMCSYNKLNGEYCSQNKRLLTDILRGEWGFDGLTISDWGATDDRVKGLYAGLDLQMPQGDVRQVAKAAENSELDISVLDTACERVIALAHKFDNTTTRNIDLDYQHEMCRRLSAECTVLVKNNCKLLPLSKSSEIAVVGALAEFPVFQGGGSSKVNAYKTDNFLSALKAANINHTYAQGYEVNGEENEQLIDEAVKTVQDAPYVILFVGDKTDSEERDRADYGLPVAQLRLIDAVTSANSNVVIVLQSGSSVDVSWAHAAKAMLIDYYGGEHSGQAMFDVIFGDVCPSGRLAETWYLNLPAYLNDFHSDYRRKLYRESIYVGYRYCTTANVPVAFPFGYGLTYNDIKWSSPALTGVRDKSKVSLSITLENKGNKADSEVVQVYATNVDSRAFSEKKRLVGFTKVRLKAGEKKTVSVAVQLSELAIYDAARGCFSVNAGKYLFTIGRDCNDDHFVVEHVISGDNDTIDTSESLSAYYNVDEEFNPSNEQFLALYGGELAQPSSTIGISTPLEDVGVNIVGKILTSLLTRSLSAEDKRYALAMPLRSFVSDGFSLDMLYTVIDMLNGVIMKNLWKLFQQYRACRKAQKEKNKLLRGVTK